jgi:hypothetical protein
MERSNHGLIKETVAYFDVQSWHLPEGMDGRKAKKNSYDSWCSGSGLILILPEHESKKHYH